MAVLAGQGQVNHIWLSILERKAKLLDQNFLSQTFLEIQTNEKPGTWELWEGFLR